MGPWPLDQRGPMVAQIAPLYWIMFACAIVVFAIVAGALIYAGIRFRDRPGHTAQQFHSNNMLELTWTVIPTLMVISFSILSWNRLNFINDVDTGDAMTVKVEGRQWAWQYTYPDQPMFKLADGSTLVAGTLDIPVGAKIKLELTSKDVIHSFFVPNMGGSKDVVPGHPNTMWIQADQPGTYVSQCNEFCGAGHADMLITIVAHTPSEYATWAKDAITQANLLNDPKTKAGRDAFLSGPCVGCHTVAGTPANGKVGPELTHIASKANIVGLLSPVNLDNLKKWITNAQAVKPGTVMPTLGCAALPQGATCLTDQQINDIAQWLLTLK